jgi:hypothetical protein
MGMPEQTYEGATQVDVKPSTILALSAEIAAGEIGVAGITKGAALAKATAKWGSAALAERRAAKVAKAGSEAALKIVEETAPPLTRAQEKAKELVELSDELSKAGIVKNVDGFNTPIMPSQVDLNNPVTAAKAEWLADQPEMADFVLKQSQMVDDAFNDILEATTSYSRKQGPIDVPLNTIVSDTLKREGSEFAATRLKALKTGQDVPVDARQFEQSLNEIAEELGFQEVQQVEVVKKGQYGVIGKSAKNPTFSHPDPDMLIARGYSKEYAHEITRRIEKMKNLLADYKQADGSVNIPFRVVAKEYNLLKKDVAALWDAGMNVDKNYRIKMTNMKQALQGVYDNAVGKILGAEEGVKYTEQVAKYSQVKSIIGDLGKVTENEIGSAALSKFTFQNAESASAGMRAKGVKDLLELAGKPEAWENIKANYIHDVIKKNTGRFGKETKVNWNKVSDTFDKLDPKVQEVLFDKRVNAGLNYNKSGSEAMRDITAFYDAVQRGTPSPYAKIQPMDPKTKFNGVKAIFSTQAKLDKVLGGLTDTFIQADKEASVARFLSKEGIEDVLKTVPAEKRGFVRRQMDRYIKRSRQWEEVKNGKAK